MHEPYDPTAPTVLPSASTDSRKEVEITADWKIFETDADGKKTSEIADRGTFSGVEIQFTSVQAAFDAGVTEEVLMDNFSQNVRITRQSAIRRWKAAGKTDEEVQTLLDNHIPKKSVGRASAEDKLLAKFGLSDSAEAKGLIEKLKALQNANSSAGDTLVAGEEAEYN
jgi:hypothetical protein